MKRVSRPVSQGLTRQLSIRHCQLVQCHELHEMRRPITRMKNDPRKPLIFRLLFPPGDIYIRNMYRVPGYVQNRNFTFNFRIVFFSYFLTCILVNEKNTTRPTRRGDLLVLKDRVIAIKKFDRLSFVILTSLILS